MVNSLNRTPPKPVQEMLRKEVNFGCPVRGCGIPYLTLHHFDPPWSEKEHHNPEGMIALCAKDAELADGGRWTKEQLRQMKKNPDVPLSKISEYYGYIRKNVVCIIGNVAYNVKNALEIYGERVIGLERDIDGYNRLNLLIRDTNRNPVLVMENNFWTAISRELFDLRCSAQGKELEIISKDKQTRLSMQFDDYTLDAFRNRLQSSIKNMPKFELPEWLNEEYKEMLRKSPSSDKSPIDEFISHIGSPEFVPTWTIKGKLLWGNVHLEIRDFEIEDLIHKTIFRMCFVLGGMTAFSFSDRSTSLGVSRN
jgi:hypothetical protein